MKKILVICLLGLAIFGYLGKNVETTQIVQNVYAGYTAGSDSELQNAIDNKQSNLQIGGSG
ncbi:MAG TPA: hypothetical protein DDW91_05680, partial [Shewanella frigidimarina]|nr:hypothetical protein [Shewanella frigidimarina]